MCNFDITVLVLLCYIHAFCCNHILYTLHIDEMAKLTWKFNLWLIKSLQWIAYNIKVQVKCIWANSSSRELLRGTTPGELSQRSTYLLLPLFSLTVETVKYHIKATSKSTKWTVSQMKPELYCHSIYLFFHFYVFYLDIRMYLTRDFVQLNWIQLFQHFHTDHPLVMFFPPIALCCSMCTSSLFFVYISNIYICWYESGRTYAFLFTSNSYPIFLL